MIETLSVFDSRQYIRYAMRTKQNSGMNYIEEKIPDNVKAICDEDKLKKIAFILKERNRLQVAVEKDRNEKAECGAS